MCELGTTDYSVLQVGWDVIQLCELGSTDYSVLQVGTVIKVCELGSTDYSVLQVCWDSDSNCVDLAALTTLLCKLVGTCSNSSAWTWQH